MMYSRKRLLIFLAFLVAGINAENSPLFADLLIFSFDRPLQLYALLESVERYATGVDTVEVIYRASDDAFDKAYNEVARRFSQVRYTKQGENPHADFKPLTIQSLENFKNNYVIFAVDDIIMTDYVNLSDCIAALEKHKAYGVYLRMGLHLTECYTLNRKQPLPPMKNLGNGMYAWQFNEGTCDWNYPNTVDMTLYRRHEILPAFKATPFKAPNSLEGNWDGYFSNSVRNRIGLCFENTKMVNLPLNLAQQEYGNRHMDFASTHDLLKVFNVGLKIAIDPLFQYRGKAAHVDYQPYFMTRS